MKVITAQVTINGLSNHSLTICSSVKTKFELLHVQHIGYIFANNSQDDEKVLLKTEKMLASAIIYIIT